MLEIGDWASLPPLSPLSWNLPSRRNTMLALLSNSATAYSLGGQGTSARVQRHTAVTLLNSRREFLGTSAAAVAATLTAASPSYAAGPKNSVSFSNVKDGDTVPSKFTYQLEVSGYELSPAADGPKPGTGLTLP